MSHIICSLAGVFFTAQNKVVQCIYPCCFYTLILVFECNLMLVRLLNHFLGLGKGINT